MRALSNREHFPVDLNSAEPTLIARIPGIGILSAKRLVALRRQKRIRFEDLTRLRCSLEKAKPFVITQDYAGASVTARYKWACGDAGAV